ncbi:MAG: PQQ-binding-like beta-propeller repeat protein [Candidatus Brocadiia bacterium]
MLPQRPADRPRGLGLGPLVVAAFALLAAPPAAAGEDAQAQARQILAETGVRGGLVVHLGCGDGTLTAALRATDSFVVQGLDGDPANVQAAREHIRSRGLYGPASATRIEGNRLPYVDGLANLVVAEDIAEYGITMAEVGRVLCPRGVAYVRRDGAWVKTARPVPDEIDEWTHYLYDSTNNAVSKDRAVGPPRRLQWRGSPRWARHHDHMSSLSSLVSANGRLFYIFDEGSTASVVLPSHWFLIARDAFNGTVLWKRPIAEWFTQLWPLKSGPALLTRRLVAAGDEVYATLGLQAPVTALDAATGETLRTYEGTAQTDEIICSDGVLFLAVNQASDRRWGFPRDDVGTIRRQVHDPRWDGSPSRILAVRADSGQVLWRRETPLSPSTLAADAQRVYYHDVDKVVALDRKTGEESWASEPMPVWAAKAVRSYFVPCLVLYDGVVLWAGGEESIPHRGGRDTMYALDARTGRTLWSAPHAPSGYQSAEDLLVAGGLVWTGATTSGGYDGIFRGYDPRTGEKKKEFPPGVEAYWFHHRCHRGKATEDYLLMSRTGIEFIDVQREKWILHHWTRGACLTGVMPCNGLVYAPPHDCACYPEAKTYGFNAMAAASPAVAAWRSREPDERLEKGPAFGDADGPAAGPGDWPTYRHDAARTGRASGAVPADLAPAWERKLDGPLSSVVVAVGKLFVAQTDAHTLHALDAATGEPAWSHTAGGRIDSPPTVWRGRCLFGSADGRVTCLRASDGALAWRFLAAPVDQRHMAFEQVESVWPVHGTILVKEAQTASGGPEAWFAAGRSMFLDGGIRLYRLDPRTGQVLSVRTMDATDPQTGESLQARHQVLQMPVALPDILSTDGPRVYMRSQVLDLEGRRTELGPHSGDLVLQATVQRGETAHLFAPYGFLDGTWFHRSYWVYGRSFSGGHGGYYQAGKFAPAGRLLAVGEGQVYGYARQPRYLRWTTALEYHLYATDRQPPELPDMAGWRQQRRMGSWVHVENAPELNPAGKPLAVEAWVKARKPNGIVVARGGPAHGYALFLREGRPHFAVRVESEVHQVAAEGKVVGRWAHLAGVLGPDKELQVYIDGELAGTGKAAGFIAEDPAQDMQIGADADRGTGVADYEGPFAFTGLIDEVRVYFGPVAAAEVRRHAQTAGDTSAKEAKLVLRFDFEKGKARDLAKPSHHGRVGRVEQAEGKVGDAMRFTGRAGGGRRRRSHFVEYHWSKDHPPLFARAMVLAADTLFVAGPPDFTDEDAIVRQLGDPKVQEKLAEQDAALRGQKGALLLAVSTADGAVRAERKLAAPPAWDAMAAANGRLYLATTDGRVLCLAGQQ